MAPAAAAGAPVARARLNTSHRSTSDSTPPSFIHIRTPPSAASRRPRSHRPTNDSQTAATGAGAGFGARGDESRSGTRTQKRCFRSGATRFFFHRRFVQYTWVRRRRGSSNPVVSARSPALVAGSLYARPGHAAGRPGSCQGVAGARPRPLGPRRRASEGAARAPARGDPEGTAAPCPLSRAQTRAIKPHRERKMRAWSRASASAIKKHPKTRFCSSTFEGDACTSLPIASCTRMRSDLDRSFLIAVGRITLNWENLRCFCRARGRAVGRPPSKTHPNRTAPIKKHPNRTPPIKTHVRVTSPSKRTRSAIGPAGGRARARAPRGSARARPKPKLPLAYRARADVRLTG